MRSMSTSNRDITRLVVKRLVQLTVFMLITAAILFVSSGRVDWPMAWLYLAVNVGTVAINTLIILPRNPELIAERAEAKENTKGWDRAFTKIGTIPFFATFVIAGLHNRFGWSPQFALATQLVALVFVAASYGLVSGAMVSNEFFSRCPNPNRKRSHGCHGWSISMRAPSRLCRDDNVLARNAFAAWIVMGTYTRCTHGVWIHRSHFT